MTDTPMTDADIERLRTMPWTTSLDVGCGVYATDEERHLHQLAAENHNAKLQVIAELVRVRAELADLKQQISGWEQSAANATGQRNAAWARLEQIHDLSVIDFNEGTP